MVQNLKVVAASPKFHNFITIVILLAGVLVGLETYPSIMAKYGDTMHVLDQAVLWIFVAEIVVKMGAEGKKPWRYFQDPWNVFDFTIVAACFMPVDAQYVTVLRLARLLRVLKLVRALPKLQLLVSALLKSIPSMAYVSLLLMLLFYVYGVAAVFIFGDNDPVHFRNLQIAMVSLFRCVTLEDWTDVMYIQMFGCDQYGYDGNEHLCTNPNAMPVVGAFFFVSFVLVGTMIILNLFIGVIMNGMDEAQSEAAELDAIERLQQGGKAPPSLDQELEGVADSLNELQATITRLSRRAKRLQAAPGSDIDPDPDPGLQTAVSPAE